MRPGTSLPLSRKKHREGKNTEKKGKKKGSRPAANHFFKNPLKKGREKKKKGKKEEKSSAIYTIYLN